MEIKKETGGGRPALELYIHIPFCVKKCLYCDFLSAPSDAETRECYLEALLAEIKGKAAEYERYSVTTVFIGGGTPSVMDGEQLERLLQSVRASYRLEPDAEITIEANPGTLEREKLASCRRAGINRFSIGLQSGDNGELRALGRIHTWEQFLTTWELVRQAGFRNVNVDLMSALPGQSLESYQTTLQKVLNLRQPPEHISAYSLIVEEETPFFEMHRRGELRIPNEDTDREMYDLTKRMLEEHGYLRYEISNYAKPGYECRHNCGYWRRTNYLGFGLGASSLVENVRFKNGGQLSEYLKNPRGSMEAEQRLTVEEQMEEFLFLGLRLTEGVSPEKFELTFGSRLEDIYGAVTEKNIRDGLLAWDSKRTRLFLTDKGLDLSNYVMSQFLLT